MFYRHKQKIIFCNTIIIVLLFSYGFINIDIFIHVKILIKKFINFLFDKEYSWFIFWSLACFPYVLFLHRKFQTKAMTEIVYHWVMDESGFCISGKKPNLSSQTLMSWMSLKNSIVNHQKLGTGCLVKAIPDNKGRLCQGFFFVKNNEYICTAWLTNNPVSGVDQTISNFALWSSLFNEYELPMLHLQRHDDYIALKHSNKSFRAWLDYTGPTFIQEYFSVICPSLYNYDVESPYIEFCSADGKKEVGWLVNWILPDETYDDNDFFIILIPLGNKQLHDYYYDDYITQSNLPLVFLNKEGCVVYRNEAWLQTMTHKYSQINFSLLSVLTAKQKEMMQYILNTKKEGIVILNTNTKKFCIRYMADFKSTVALADYYCFSAHAFTEYLQNNVNQDFIGMQKLQTLGVLSSNVAHDFNNILTSIVGFCDLIIDKIETENQHPQVFLSDIKEIKMGAFRASGVVRQLLFFSRQDEPVKNIFNAAETLDQFLIMARNLLSSKIYISFKKEQEDCYILSDSGQFHQIILNFIINSRDAILPNGGNIDIVIRIQHFSEPLTCINRILPVGNYVVVSVTDTGCGIAPENLNNIFKRFFSTKNPDKGTGLGLSTCYEIIDQNNGGIQVETELGKGSTMIAIFPQQKPITVDRTMLLNEKKNDKNLYSSIFLKKKVLFVEDDKSVRLVLSTMLRQKGCIIDEAEDSAKAMEYIKKNIHQYSIVMMDIEIPGMISGIGLAEEVASRNDKIDIIFISGHTRDIIPLDIKIKSHKVHFLSKPFSAETILDKIFHILYEQSQPPQ